MVFLAYLFLWQMKKYYRIKFILDFFYRSEATMLGKYHQTI